MDKKKDISDELKLLSPVIAEMDKINVFTVPQGYFDTIASTVLACLHEEQSIFNEPEHRQPNQIPEGYFDQLATSILDRIKANETATEEIRNLSPLLYSIQNRQVFEVPAGYFENIHKIIIEKISAAGTKEELKEISPLLYGISNKTVFEVPGGYFDTLAGNILKKVQPQIAKVVLMPKRRLFIKYAAAAMITIAAGLGLYKYTGKAGSGITIAITAAIPALDSSIEKGKSMNDLQFSEALNNLKEADIAKYLENNGDVTDVAAINNNLEDINLPSQDDYLLDETTLDNYLKEIDKTTLNN